MNTPPPAPAELRYLADLIGEDATLALLDALGGTRVHIPVEPRAGSALCTAIGEDAVRLLGAVFGGCRLKLPTAKRWRAMAHAAGGKSCVDIALRLGVTDTIVRSWISAGRTSGRGDIGADRRRRTRQFPIADRAVRQTEFDI